MRYFTTHKFRKLFCAHSILRRTGPRQIAAEMMEARRSSKVTVDQIRNELIDKDILIEDTNGKTTWKFK